MNEQTIILNTKVDSLSFIDITVLRTSIPITSLRNALRFKFLIVSSSTIIQKILYAINIKQITWKINIFDD